MLFYFRHIQKIYHTKIGHVNVRILFHDNKVTKY